MMGQPGRGLASVACRRGLRAIPLTFTTKKNEEFVFRVLLHGTPVSRSLSAALLSDRGVTGDLATESFFFVVTANELVKLHMNSRTAITVALARGDAQTWFVSCTVDYNTFRVYLTDSKCLIWWVPLVDALMYRDGDPLVALHCAIGRGKSGPDSPHVEARLISPWGITVAPNGDLYFTEKHCLRKLSKGVLSTVAGTDYPGYQDGIGSTARFKDPRGICINRENGNIYVADNGNNRIRCVDSNGMVTTIGGNGIQQHADGAASGSSFYFPWAVDTDSHGNIYVSDFCTHSIRVISPKGMVSTILWQLEYPGCVVIQPYTSHMYVLNNGSTESGSLCYVNLRLTPPWAIVKLLLVGWAKDPTSFFYRSAFPIHILHAIIEYAFGLCLPHPLTVGL
ncbi:copper amine oxidase [Pelomyxa schiedti]|nr:copper amine oxidase [Pelomyxa schiedti]